MERSGGSREGRKTARHEVRHPPPSLWLGREDRTFGDDVAPLRAHTYQGKRRAEFIPQVPAGGETIDLDPVQPGRALGGEPHEIGQPGEPRSES